MKGSPRTTLRPVHLDDRDVALTVLDREVDPGPAHGPRIAVGGPGRVVEPDERPNDLKVRHCGSEYFVSRELSGRGPLRLREWTVHVVAGVAPAERQHVRLHSPAWRR